MADVNFTGVVEPIVVDVFKSQNKTEWGAYLFDGAIVKEVPREQRNEPKVRIINEDSSVVVGNLSSGAVQAGSQLTPTKIEVPIKCASTTIEKDAYYAMESGNSEQFKNTKCMPKILVEFAKDQFMNDVGFLMAKGQVQRGANAKAITKALSKIDREGTIKIWMDAEVNADLTGEARMNQPITIDGSWKGTGEYNAWGFAARNLRGLYRINTALAATIGTDGTVSFTSSNATAGKYYDEDGYLVLATSTSAGVVIGGVHPASSKTVSAASSAKVYGIMLGRVDGVQITASADKCLDGDIRTNINGLGIVIEEVKLGGHKHKVQVTACGCSAIGDYKGGAIALYELA